LTTAQPLLKKGVTFYKDFTPDTPTINSDPAKIKQIVINLLSNAAKFTHEGQITVKMAQKGDDWTVAVIDTGIGISKEALPRIFTEFEQAESTTRQNYGGTGLGLPISLSLARLLGGDLTAVSQLGQGTTFTLAIPIAYSGDSRQKVNPR
jgi:signal transduction histidine kinase